jgi:DNA-binding NarL/FixJ family response regulator
LTIAIRAGCVGLPEEAEAAHTHDPDREVEILRLLTDGSANADLAQRLFISTKTVDHHVSALLSKLQVASRRHAARRAAELSIVA